MTDCLKSIRAFRQIEALQEQIRGADAKMQDAVRASGAKHDELDQVRVQLEQELEATRLRLNYTLTALGKAESAQPRQGGYFFAAAPLKRLIASSLAVGRDHSPTRTPSSPYHLTGSPGSPIGRVSSPGSPDFATSPGADSDSLFEKTKSHIGSDAVASSPPPSVEATSRRRRARGARKLPSSSGSRGQKSNRSYS